VHLIAAITAFFTSFGTGNVVENSAASDLALLSEAYHGPETGSLHARFVSNRGTYAHILIDGATPLNVSRPFIVGDTGM
jgi:hypothetical protein